MISTSYLKRSLLRLRKVSQPLVETTSALVGGLLGLFLRPSMEQLVVYGVFATTLWTSMHMRLEQTLRDTEIAMYIYQYLYYPSRVRSLLRLTLCSLELGCATATIFPARYMLVLIVDFCKMLSR
jgi:hypothetical protein